MKNKIILITGATGSLGQTLVDHLISPDRKPSGIRKVIVFSRDEYKQVEMRRVWDTNKFPIRYFIGDVRDKSRLSRAFEGVNYIIHAAAMKHVDVCHYNPFEAVQTNVVGAQNIIDAAIDRRVERVIAISSDKSVNPINLYGATKLCADRLFIAADSYSAGRTRFAVIRFGNFIGSRGSVLPYFEQLHKNGEELPITDSRMTRFWIDIDDAAKATLMALRNMKGGEIYVPKTKAGRLVDMVKEGFPEARIVEVGVRQGEKLHEELIATAEAPRTMDMGSHFVVAPSLEMVMGAGGRVEDGFRYSSS